MLHLIKPNFLANLSSGRETLNEGLCEGLVRNFTAGDSYPKITFHTITQTLHFTSTMLFLNFVTHAH